MKRALPFVSEVRSLFQRPSAALLPIFSIFALTSTVMAQGPPPPFQHGGEKAADAGLRQAIERVVYRVEPSGQATYRAANPAQRLAVEFDARAARLQHAQGNVTFRLLGYGYGEHLRTPVEAKPAATDNRIEYRRGELTEWYVNEAPGLEQGFTLDRRPGTAQEGEPLVIAMAVEGGLRPALAAGGDAVLLESGGRTILRYGGLRSWDARGRTIASRLEVRERQVRLVVEDRDAEYPLVVDPIWTQEAKLTASDGLAGDAFGVSVSVSGDTAVVGAGFKKIGLNRGQGEAYVFVRSGTTWTQQQTLTALDGATNAVFGFSVSVSGDTAVVGAPNQDENDSPGAAYVFTRSGTTWTQQQKLTASDGSFINEFGISVSVSGDTAVVGAFQQQPVAAAYVFVRSGTTWTQQQKLTASDPVAGDDFGFSVSVSGDTAVVGASFAAFGGSVSQGKAYVFVRSGTTWTQQQKLTASDGVAGDLFGFSVSVGGDTAVVGATGNNSRGAAYVFVRSGTTWTQQQKLTASDGLAGDAFGTSVSVSGDTAVVGAIGNNSQGAAYVFVRNGTTWTQQQKLTASDGVAGDFFGRSVSVDQGTAVIGAQAKNSAQGAAYVFRNTGSSGPDFLITKSHVGNFTPGQVGATYTITVMNTGTASTAGAVTVTDTVPVGLTPTAAAGSGWGVCSIVAQTVTCIRSDALATGISYPAITLTVTVSATAPATVTNSATVTGGGVTADAADTANDATTIVNPNTPVPAISPFGLALLMLMLLAVALYNMRSSRRSSELS